MKWLNALAVFIVLGGIALVAVLKAPAVYGQRDDVPDRRARELTMLAGRGSALGALLGALIIKIIDTGIVIIGIDQSYSRIIIGVAVILAVVLDQFNNWLAKRRLTKTV